jgi:formyltetrahydrofolate-dependent phosphoribosylglycinamide formyltransferase (EC 2.1.2.2)
LKRARLAVLVSGRGRNLSALAAACADGRIAADIVRVGSDRPAAAALELARAAGLNTVALPPADYPDRQAFDRALLDALQAAKPDYLLLAGYMRILSADFVAAWRGRMLNIHPSLLPRHPGLHTHRRVLEAGDREHGATVHFVTEALDAGPAVIQGGFSVRPEDGEQALAERVMNEVELRIYPQAVAWLARGELRLDGDRAVLRDLPLDRPLGLDALEPAFR